MVDIIFKYLYMFMFCATFGWFLEVAYRSIKHKKLINPGFLEGPCLPIYGAGGMVLFLMASIDLSFLPNMVLEVILRFLMDAVAMTLIELIAGEMMLRIYHNRLWDYSNDFLNFKGLICLKFSFFWGLIGIGFYYLAFKFLQSSFDYTYSNRVLFFVMGIYYGILIIDLVKSLNLMDKARAYALEHNLILNFEDLKISVKQVLAERKESTSLFFLKARYEIKRFFDNAKSTFLSQTNKNKELNLDEDSENK